MNNRRRRTAKARRKLQSMLHRRSTYPFWQNQRVAHDPAAMESLRVEMRRVYEACSKGAVYFLHPKSGPMCLGGDL